MRFGKHIGKGLWAFADKALPAIYGLGFIFLVVRVLPEKEYGAFAIIQSIFLIVSTLGFSLCLQPMTKFVAESRDHGSFIVAGSGLLIGFFGIVSLGTILFKEMLATLLDPRNQANLHTLLLFVPLLLFVTVYRNIAISLLQAEYRVQRIFWIDAMYFLGTLILFAAARWAHRFATAEDIIRLNAIGLALSSFLGLVLIRPSVTIKLEIRRDAFRKIWDFGKYNFGGSINYLIYSQMDVFLVSSFAGIVALASYSAAKIITRLFDMLSQVLQMFIMPAASKYYARDDRKLLGVIIEKAISFSCLAFLPVCLFLLFFPQQFLHLLYSGKYDGAAPTLRVFALLAIVVPWTSVFAATLIGIGRVRLGFLVGLVVTTIFLMLSWVLGRSYGAIGVAISLVASNVFSAVALGYFTKRDVEFEAWAVVRRVKDVMVFVREQWRSLQQ